MQSRIAPRDRLGKYVETRVDISIQSATERKISLRADGA